MNKLMMVIALVLALGACSKKKEGNAGAAIAKMTELKDEMCKCKDAACAQDVSARMQKWASEQPEEQKNRKPSDAERKQLAAIGDEIGKCMATAMTAAPPPPPAGSDTPPPAGSGNAGSADVVAPPQGMPPECAAYKETVEKLKPCDKLPPKAKEALIKAYNDAATGWANLPEGAKAGLKTSCKAGAEAVAEAAKAACGW
ncbi:MAG TPA: hypothetical protein VFV99_24440 [Kofleriaceae bacterium]|nr:hypothetical protein [Kofleriaceae bacterium]